MEGQMDLFNPPDMHIVNAHGELSMDGVRKPYKEVRELPIA